MIGGVGQRVLSGVAKKTAGEFFQAVDDVLTGKAPSVPAPRGETDAPGRPCRRAPGVFTASAAAGGGRWARSSSRARCSARWWRWPASSSAGW